MGIDGIHNLRRHYDLTTNGLHDNTQETTHFFYSHLETLHFLVQENIEWYVKASQCYDPVFVNVFNVVLWYFVRQLFALSGNSFFTSLASRRHRRLFWLGFHDGVQQLTHFL